MVEKWIGLVDGSLRGRSEYELPITLPWFDFSAREFPVARH